MNSILENYLSFLNESIELGKFDKEFFYSLPGKRELYHNKKDCRYYTILYNGEKAGIVGFCWSARKPENEGFAQIIIQEKFRGKSILKTAYDLLVKKENLVALYASINNNNVSSIKSHLSAGFKKVSSKREEELRGSGFLQKGYSRYVKKY